MQEKIMPTAPPKLSRVDIPDAQIHYLAYGDCGPTVVLLHATGFLPWLWHPIAEALAKDHRVIAPCFYNHRPSDLYAGGLPWLRLADDLKQMCIRLGIENPYLVGHSMGATVATLAHAVHGASSACLILIEPIFLPPEAYRTPMRPDQHPLAGKAIKRRNHWPDRAAVRKDFKAKPFFRSWEAEVLGLYIEYGIRAAGASGVELSCSPWQEASLFMGGMHHDPWPELPKVSCPALVVEGGKSENRLWIDLKRAAELIPHGRYAKVEDAGHLVPMEKPAQTARLIRSFIEESVR
ncbi:MAG: alpha/beta hydrolase [Desulfobacteraceae bacterium]|nr:MAG: alpha/beta hydrolase [Desulfobacteraceae bacterium]